MYIHVYIYYISSCLVMHLMCHLQAQHSRVLLYLTSSWRFLPTFPGAAQLHRLLRPKVAKVSMGSMGVGYSSARIYVICSSCDLIFDIKNESSSSSWVM